MASQILDNGSRAFVLTYCQSKLLRAPACPNTRTILAVALTSLIVGCIWHVYQYRHSSASNVACASLGSTAQVIATINLDE